MVVPGASPTLPRDRVAHGLHARALVISRALHVVAVLCLLALEWVADLHAFYGFGVAGVSLLLMYEQSLVRADDLTQVKRAFDLNGYVGILYLLVLAAAIYVG